MSPALSDAIRISHSQKTVHQQCQHRPRANLSDWPQAKIETLRRLLKDEPLVSPTDAFDIIRSKPHGHVAAVHGTLRKLGLDRMISARPCAERERWWR